MIVSVHDLSAWPISLSDCVTHLFFPHTHLLSNKTVCVCVCFVVVVAVFFFNQTNRQSQTMTTGKLSDGHVNRPHNYPTVGCVCLTYVCVCVWEII
jgi:hypothetical protein